MSNLSNNFRERSRFLRDHQLRGGTRDSAMEAWRASEEIAEVFEHDGIRTADQLANADVRDAIEDWIAVRKAGL